MNTKQLELLLRPTRFCAALLAQTWDVLNASQRIDLMLQLDELSDELKYKALKDSNSVVRMLAVTKTLIEFLEDEEPELYAKLINDKSPLVRAAMNADKLSLLSDSSFKDLIPLSHFQRLGVIALSDTIGETFFAKFIIEGLRNQHISEDEAAQLITEFVRNPNFHGGLDSEPLDDDVLDAIRRDFEAIWNLTTCTPEEVHYIIAQEYPLKFGFGNTIPSEIFKKMSQYALEMIVLRGCEPLLKDIEKNPEQFDEEIRNTVQHSAELRNRSQSRESSEGEKFLEELKEFRSEINEKLNTILYR